MSQTSNSLTYSDFFLRSGCAKYFCAKKKSRKIAAFLVQHPSGGQEAVEGRQGHPLGAQQVSF